MKRKPMMQNMTSCNNTSCKAQFIIRDTILFSPFHFFKYQLFVIIYLLYYNILYADKYDFEGILQSTKFKDYRVVILGEVILRILHSMMG